MGRNSALTPWSEFNEQARKLCLLGATDSELADFFGVCERTINNWKSEFPAFLQSIDAGKISADAIVKAVSRCYVGVNEGALDSWSSK